MAGAPWNILDETGRRIIWCHGNDYKGNSSEEDEANASHIVAAVNALDDLLRACGEARAIIRDDMLMTSNQRAAVVEQLTNAIKKGIPK